MVKRKTKQMSSSRQQTVTLDRRRTRAVSMYLADHREILLNMLPKEMKTDKNTKRKELEKIARKDFHKASESEQRTYYARVSASGEFRSSGEGEQLVESRSGGEGEQLVEFRSADEGGQPSIEQPLVEPRSIIEEQLVEFRGRWRSGVLAMARLVLHHGLLPVALLLQAAD